MEKQRQIPCSMLMVIEVLADHSVSGNILEEYMKKVPSCDHSSNLMNTVREKIAVNRLEELVDNSTVCTMVSAASSSSRKPKFDGSEQAEKVLAQMKQQKEKCSAEFESYKWDVQQFTLEKRTGFPKSSIDKLNEIFLGGGYSFLRERIGLDFTHLKEDMHHPNEISRIHQIGNKVVQEHTINQQEQQNVEQEEGQHEGVPHPPFSVNEPCVYAEMPSAQQHGHPDAVDPPPILETEDNIDVSQSRRKLPEYKEEGQHEGVPHPPFSVNEPCVYAEMPSAQQHGHPDAVDPQPMNPGDPEKILKTGHNIDVSQSRRKLPEYKEDNLDLNLRPRRFPWTIEEEEKLKEGVQQFGAAIQKNLPWKKILAFGQGVFLPNRKPDDLKDKWRRM